MHRRSTSRKIFLARLTAAVGESAAAQESRSPKHSSFEESCKALIGQAVPGGAVATAQFVVPREGTCGTHSQDPREFSLVESLAVTVRIHSRVAETSDVLGQGNIETATSFVCR